MNNGVDENEEKCEGWRDRTDNSRLGGRELDRLIVPLREMFRPAPSIAITPEPFSVLVDNRPEVGLSHAPRWALAISYDAVLVADDERRLVWVPMVNCRLKLANS